LSVSVVETIGGEDGPYYYCRVWLPSGRRTTVARGSPREPVVDVRERLEVALAAAASTPE
jgi:hypothetical protein